MTTIYSSVSVSGYNSSPPADDGSAVSTNQITWSKHKTKIGDPLKTAIEDINTQAASGFGKILHSATTQITTTTTLSDSDRGKTIATTNTLTVNLPAVGTVGDNYVATIVNTDGGTVTVDGDGAETINGSTTLTLGTQYSGAFFFSDGTEWFALEFGGANIGGYQAITSLQDADQFPVADNSDSDSNKKITYANVKTQLQTDLPASDTAVGFVEKATKAEMIAETADKYPDASLMKNSPGFIGAWVKFSDSSGTPTIDDSYNVSSITDNAVGDFTINFTNDFANEHYVPFGTTKRNNTTNTTHGSLSVRTLSGSQTVSSCRMSTRAGDGGALTDMQSVFVAFVGELA